MISELREAGVEVTYQPAHVAVNSFPLDQKAIAAFDVVTLSDIGANSLLLPDEAFENNAHDHTGVGCGATRLMRGRNS